MNFIKTLWYVIKKDVMDVFHEFHSKGKFVRALNS